MKRLVPIAAVLLLTVQVAQAQSFQTWNRECGKLAKNWGARPKHKAAAISSDTSYEACGLSWGNPTVQAAEQAAMKWCRKSAEGAPCHVVTSE